MLHQCCIIWRDKFTGEKPWRIPQVPQGSYEDPERIRSCKDAILQGSLRSWRGSLAGRNWQSTICPSRILVKILEDLLKIQDTKRKTFYFSWEIPWGLLKFLEGSCKEKFLFDNILEDILKSCEDLERQINRILKGKLHHWMKCRQNVRLRRFYAASFTSKLFSWNLEHSFTIIVLMGISQNNKFDLQNTYALLNGK